MTGQNVATYIALTITAVWVLSLFLDAVVKAYDPPSTLHALMMAVAGWAFGERYLRRPPDSEGPQ